MQKEKSEYFSKLSSSKHASIYDTYLYNYEQVYKLIL